MKLQIFILCAAIFCSCGPVYVKVADDAFAPERAFLESVFERDEFEDWGLRLARGAEGEAAPAVFIEFFSSYQSAGEAAAGDVLVSKTYLVPRADPLDGRTDTTLAACLENSEDLVPPDEIAPPFVALRVDGYAIGDEDYPLILYVTISVRAVGDKEPSGSLRKKTQLLEESLLAQPKPLILDAPKPFWISVGGDMMLDRGASDILFKDGPKGIFGGTAEMLASADLALVNLEGVISNRGEKVKKSFNFRFVPEIAPALKDAGIDAVLHANNHVFDYGMDAFVDSLSYLNKAGIGIAGAGVNIEAASDPFVFTRGDETFRVFGIASFPRERNGWDGVSAAAGPELAGMLHAERNGREKLKEKLSHGDSIDIVLFHGGVEWSARPDAPTRELYTDLINAGADLVIGSHPHIVQGFEWVQGKPVFWSLGNYVFGGMDNTEGGEQGLFIRLGYLGARLLYIEPFALSLSHTRTDIAPPENLARFYTLSRELQPQ